MKMHKSNFVVMLVLALALLFAMPVMAEHPQQPQLNGTASASSFSGGSVVSGNFGNGASLAFQQSYNVTTSGFGTQKNGNQVTANTYGSSMGATHGFAINGLVIGIQGGAYNATATMSIPKK